METPRQKFVRLANNRVNNALNTIRLIGNLSNTSNYTYNSKDVQKIFNKLEEEIERTKKLFQGKNKELSKFDIEEM